MSKVFFVNPALNGTKEISKVLNENFKDAYFIDDLEKVESINGMVYIIGGDGTINEVVNRIYPKIKEISIIPFGKNNNTYKSINKDTIDIGLINEQIFLNSVVVGIPDVDKIRNNYLSNVQRYFNGLEIFEMITNVGRKCNISDVLLFCLCNGNYIDNNIKINNGNMDDGLFELYLLGNTSNLRILKQLLKLFSLSKNKHCDKISLDYLHADFMRNVNCHIDGEIKSLKNFNFKINKNGLRIVRDKEVEKILVKI